MKTRSALLLPALFALLGQLPAQAANSTPAAPRAPASAPVVQVNPPADLSALAPRDSAQKPVDTRNSLDRYNSRGVNCSNYPARCR